MLSGLFLIAPRTTTEIYQMYLYTPIAQYPYWGTILTGKQQSIYNPT